MKTVCTLILALITTIGFSQEKEQRKEMRQKMMQERQGLSPEQKAELSAKRLTLQLDLTEAQQKEVHKLQFEMISEREKNKELRKTEAEENGFYDKATARLDKSQEYQNKMKSILNESQYQTWKEGMKKSSGNKLMIKHKKQQ
ncbi:MAG: hypothetical protein NXH73_08305 [Flavobacteriaceae bacterium]|nr:hypothetical protein [Flavobacteriaceae bacterium]